MGRDLLGPGAAGRLSVGGRVPSSIGRLSSDVDQALALYAAGFFPMDDLDEAFGPLPFYAAEDRALFELDEGTRARVRRRVRRSLRAGEGWALRMDTAFDTVLEGCARPREEDDGVWITPRLATLYREMHDAGYAHSFEVHAGDRLAAGMLAILMGRAARWSSVRGYHFADVQLPTEHTMRLGARLVSRAQYERRLQAAIS